MTKNQWIDRLSQGPITLRRNGVVLKNEKELQELIKEGKVIKVRKEISITHKWTELHLKV